MTEKSFARWFREQHDAMRPLPSQEALSELLDVAQETVSKWRRVGVASLPPATIRRIATVFRVDPVEVADALGYPTHPRAVVILPLSADAWMQAVSDLNNRVQETQERWAEELFPPQAEEREPNGRSG